MKAVWRGWAEKNRRLSFEERYILTRLIRDGLCKRNRPRVKRDAARFT